MWVRPFDAVAERRKWYEDAKLDNLLPRLQGEAREFEFSQLPSRTLSNYEELVRELNSRFRVVEAQKTFAAKFSQRSQRNDEAVEEYAADLKRLYAKAYKSRDEKVRQEDLVRRFLDGLKDDEARFKIEFHKETDDIDNAVYHAVNFLQTRRRSSGDNFADKKFKRYMLAEPVKRLTLRAKYLSNGRKMNHMNRPRDYQLLKKEETTSAGDIEMRKRQMYQYRKPPKRWTH